MDCEVGFDCGVRLGGLWGWVGFIMGLSWMDCEVGLGGL